MVSLGMVVLALVVISSAYVYQASKILMKGSIFANMRFAIDQRASEELSPGAPLRRRAKRFFYMKVREMLGCMLCTSTEVAIWSLGVPLFIYGLVIHFWSQVAGFRLPFWSVEVLGMLLMGFVVALGIAGIAQGFHEFFEHRPRRFVALRNDYDARVSELQDELDAARADLAQSESRVEGLEEALSSSQTNIVALQTSLVQSQKMNASPDARQALPDLLSFREMYGLMMEEGFNIRCPMSRATHRLRFLDKLIREAQPPSRNLILLSQIINDCIRRENKVWNLVRRQAYPEDIYQALCDQIAKTEAEPAPLDDPRSSDGPPQTFA